jgi:hypothetical protein
MPVPMYTNRPAALSFPDVNPANYGLASGLDLDASEGAARWLRRRRPSTSAIGSATDSSPR